MRFAAILPEYLFTPEYNGGYVAGEGAGNLGLGARIWEKPDHGPANRP